MVVPCAGPKKIMQVSFKAFSLVQIFARHFLILVNIIINIVVFCAGVRNTTEPQISLWLLFESP